MYDIIRVNDNVYDELYPKQCLIDFTIPKTSHSVPVLIYFHRGDLETGGRKEEFIQSFAAEYGVAVAAVDHRMYPFAQYPDFLNDAGRACEYVWNYGKNTGLFNRFYIGGSDAGAYIAMMLYFCPVYMREFIMSPDMFNGFIFDGGYPTTHPSILQERCVDRRAVRVDKAAPIYYLDTPPSPPEGRPPVLIITAENDLPGLSAQNDLLAENMADFGYRKEKTKRVVMKGFSHGEYITGLNEEGKYPINRVFGEFITKNFAQNCK